MAKAILTAKANDTFITATAEEYIKLEEDTSLKSTVSNQYGISGGWTDGKYLYRAFITSYDSTNEDNNEVVIVKYDLTTGEIVKQSEKLPLNHANDITYNSKTNQLVVSHGVSTTVSLIDADSLELEGTKTLPCLAGIMDYNPTYDCYALARAQLHHLYILDKDFNPIQKYEVDLYTHPQFHPKGTATGVSPQGNACDDKCIYYLFSSGTEQEYKHVITVFDWNGNYMTEIEFQLDGVEPEAISVVGNTIYVMRSKENTVYKISF